MSFFSTANRFHLAAAEGSVDRVKFFVQRRDVAELDDFKNTPLFYAVWYNQLAVVEVLLLRMLAKDVNRLNIEGNSALHYAVARGPSHSRIIETLVDYGADIKCKNKKNITPQDIMRRSGEFDSCRSLKLLFELGTASSVNRLFVNQLQGVRKRKLMQLDEKRRAQERRGMVPEQVSDLRFVHSLLLKRGRPDTAARTRGLQAHHLRPLFSALHLNPSKEELKDILQLMDSDGDGVVSQLDFAEAVLLREPTETYSVKYAEQIPFDALDRDGDGILGKADFQELAAELGSVFCASGDFEISHSLRGFAADSRDEETPPKVVGLTSSTFAKLAKGQLDTKELEKATIDL